MLLVGFTARISFEDGYLAGILLFADGVHRQYAWFGTQGDCSRILGRHQRILRPATVFAATSFVTTASAATTALSPIVTPCRIVALEPTQTFLPARWELGKWFSAFRAKVHDLMMQSYLLLG